MTDIREKVREQERDILTMNDEDLISEVRKGHMAVAGFVRSHGSEASKHECLRAFEAFDELADRLRRYRSMPLTDVPVAPAGIEELREAMQKISILCITRPQKHPDWSIVSQVADIANKALSRLQPSEQSEREGG